MEKAAQTSFQPFNRLGEYEKALDFIHQASVFRTPGYLEKIHFEHVWILFEKANELAEDGHLEVAKRLVELCPKPTETALEEVMRIRKTSIMNRSWWGWDALGVGKATRGRLLAEQNRKERQRRKRR